MFRAGVAAAEITPNGPVPLFGYPRVERVSSGVHDPLFASALYLDNGDCSVVLIALDLLMLDTRTARALRRSVARRVAVPESHVFVSCTHTHSGPVTSDLLAWHGDPAVPPPDPAYLESVAERAAEAALRAATAARPVEIAWTVADAKGIGGNRLSADGVTDPEAGLLVVRPSDGDRPLALVIVYGMHPTVLHEDSTLVSADFVHYTRQQLRDRFGQPLTVLYHTAPCGNQSPRRFVRAQTFEEAERLGRALGRAIVGAVDRLKADDFHRSGPLGGLLSEIDLPRRAIPSPEEAECLLARYRDEYRRLRSEQAKPAEVRTAECAVFGAEGNLVLARLQQEARFHQMLRACLPIEVQTLRIAEGYLAGLPGELFTEYALEMKSPWTAAAFCGGPGQRPPSGILGHRRGGEGGRVRGDGCSVRWPEGRAAARRGGVGTVKEVVSCQLPVVRE